MVERAQMNGYLHLEDVAVDVLGLSLGLRWIWR